MEPIAVISGEVLKGSQRGRMLGFPTANMKLLSHIPEGIYIAETLIGGKSYPSAAFVGAAVTFGEEERKLETYILDFHGDLYGKTVTVTLYKKIRDNKKFDSTDSLIAEIKNDIVTVRSYFYAGGATS